MNKKIHSINAFIATTENRIGLFKVSIFTGLLFLLIVSTVSAIRMETFYHGNGFTRLSVHPFETQGENDLRFRILSPLMGYILFFRGPAFKYFMLLILAVFFGLLYFFKRREEYTPIEAIGVTSVFVFSTLSFYQLYFPAYTDPTSFVLILLLMSFYRNKILSLILIMLLLFNHESNIFLFPFFFLLMLDGDYSFKNILGILSRFVIAAFPYIIFRKIFSMNAEITFTLDYYFDRKNMQWTFDHVMPHLASGIFQAFRLSWIFLLAAISIDIYEKRYREILLMVTIVVFVLCQLIIAWDISRLVGLAFPAILISLNRIRIYLGSEKFQACVYSVVLLNFLIPAYCIGALDPIPYTPFWLR